ncbi:MAG: YgiT-type zinc finger protein [Anaerolineales bacterium]|nr:YgiT-type zinc finger protein [Anaerolineales bacterium]MCS7246959.1 YgiT-type zinc finger protein [Anaerolineales bacterium]MDW8160770.1 YgiT-type zinc finger protein [Anaerolineales bacterium]MDW8445726.1 YgiT-type zinc finger protein [Anaerolineales bacterium]
MNGRKPSEGREVQVAHCPECISGILRLKYITYFTWLNDELITVPNFPAWVCDLCGRREYDQRAISWLNTLLNPEAGKRVRRKRRVASEKDSQMPKKPFIQE